MTFAPPFLASFALSLAPEASPAHRRWTIEVRAVTFALACNTGDLAVSRRLRATLGTLLAIVDMFQLW